MKICQYLLKGLTCLALVHCAGDSDNGSSIGADAQTVTCTPYSYTLPSRNDDGIAIADIESKAIDVARIVDMAEQLHCGERNHKVHSVLIAINEELVHEQYFPGVISADNRQRVNYGPDSLHVQASVTKSIIAATLGIAEAQGLLDVNSTSIFDIYSDYNEVNWTAFYTLGDETIQKTDLMLTDFLTMSAGFEWDEFSTYYGHPDNSLTKMNTSDDPIGYLLALDLATPPGETFVYNTGLSRVISDVVERVSGQSIQSYTEQHLFNPLGIATYHWQRGLSIRPRDMLKFGLLFNNNGNYQGEQIIPQAWVARSLARELTLTPNERLSGYGHQWWQSDFVVEGTTITAHAALGYGGQQIYLFKDYDAVVVFTAGEYAAQHGDTRTVYGWLNDFIVPALVSGANTTP